MAIGELKSRYGVKRLVLVGHSGGAVISGVLMGRRPDLIDGVMLISCPCNIPKWRRTRGRQPLSAAQSPHRGIEKAPTSAMIVALTGSNDRNTVPSLARNYVDAAKARGLDAEFVLVDGAGHGLRRAFRSPVLSALDRLTYVE